MLMLLEIAKASGFVISADDLNKGQAEVSDKELEEASGGTTTMPTNITCPSRRS